MVHELDSLRAEGLFSFHQDDYGKESERTKQGGVRERGHGMMSEGLEGGCTPRLGEQARSSSSSNRRDTKSKLAHTIIRFLLNK